MTDSAKGMLLGKEESSGLGHGVEQTMSANVVETLFADSGGREAVGVVAGCDVGGRGARVAGCDAGACIGGGADVGEETATVACELRVSDSGMWAGAVEEGRGSAARAVDLVGSSTPDSSYRVLQARRRRRRQQKSSNSRDGHLEAAPPPATVSSSYPELDAAEERQVFSSTSELRSLGEDVCFPPTVSFPPASALDGVLPVSSPTRLFVERGDRFVSMHVSRGGGIRPEKAPLRALSCFHSAARLAMGVQDWVSALGVFSTGIGAGVSLCQALLLIVYWWHGLEPVSLPSLSLTLQLVCSLSSVLAAVSALDRCDPAASLSSPCRPSCWLLVSVFLVLVAVTAGCAPLLQCRCGPSTALQGARACLSCFGWLIICCCHSFKQDRLLLALKRHLSSQINTIDASIHSQLQPPPFS